MKKFTLTIVIALLWVAAVAQVPGYEGKKLAIMYNNNFSPVLSSFRVNYKGQRGLFALNDKHLLGLEYVGARRRMIGIALEYMRTAISGGGIAYMRYPTSYEYKVLNGDTTLTYTSTESYYYYEDKLFRIQNAGLRLYWKFFGKRYIAPWGKYNRIDFGIMKYWEKNTVFEPFTYTRRDYYYNYNTSASTFVNRTATITPQTDPQKYTCFLLGYGFGKQRILFNKFIFDYGLKISVLLGEGELNYTPYEMRARLSSASWFGFNLGVGYLAY